jgi:hypothetical protein
MNMTETPPNIVTGYLRAAGFGLRHIEALDALERNPGQRRILDSLMPLMGTGTVSAVIGNRGTGKTQLAAHLAATQLRLPTPRPVLFVKAAKMFEQMRATFGREKTDMDKAAKLYSVPLLIIDECQVRGNTKYEDDQLTALIDERYDDKLDTLLIANTAPGSLEEQLGSSVADRLRETGRVFELTGVSFREPERINALRAAQAARKPEAPPAAPAPEETRTGGAMAAVASLPDDAPLKLALQRVGKVPSDINTRPSTIEAIREAKAKFERQQA